MTVKKNKVELLGYYGSDTVIACSAWTSTSREFTRQESVAIIPSSSTCCGAMVMRLLSKRGCAFSCDTEIASHIHLLKHRMSSLQCRVSTL